MLQTEQTGTAAGFRGLGALDATRVGQRTERMVSAGNQGYVTVERQGRWLVFSGRVVSQEVKRRIFASVPERQGARWIVDRLEVGRAVTAREVA